MLSRICTGAGSATVTAAMRDSNDAQESCWIAVFSVQNGAHLWPKSPFTHDESQLRAERSLTPLPSTGGEARYSLGFREAAPSPQVTKCLTRRFLITRRQDDTNRRSFSELALRFDA